MNVSEVVLRRIVIGIIENKVYTINYTNGYIYTIQIAILVNVCNHICYRMINLRLSYKNILKF